MRKQVFAVLPLLAASVFAPRLALAQKGLEVITGKEFDSAMPKDFYLEGNAIPTEKRNAALVRTPAGARVLFALIDTTGYSSQIKQKYIGMIINEGAPELCGRKLGVGSYGFGLTRPAEAGSGAAQFFVYDQAGNKVAECSAEKDSSLKQPRPLQVVAEKGGSACLYLGRYKVEIK